MKNQTHNKPEAMSIILDGLETRGLYKPEDISYIPEIDGEKPEQKKELTLTLDQYGELHKRAIDAGINGDVKRAEHIRGIMDRHAPDFILNLKPVKV